MTPTQSPTRTAPPTNSRTLLLTTALPLAGWALHAVAMHKRLAGAERDPLTGLLRRGTYTQRAQRVLRRYRDQALVVLVDADHFKQINDSFGHAAGDRVLAATGDRLATWAGPHAAVGRLGGDEFAVTLPFRPLHREAALERLVQALHAPVPLDTGEVVEVAASVGAATPEIVGTLALSRLQRAADVALYAGKHTGRAHQATAAQAQAPSVNGRRAGRPGAGAP